jgi:hypothetical protein
MGDPGGDRCRVGNRRCALTPVRATLTAMAGGGRYAPKTRRGLRPDALREVPHPRFVRAGQRYFPLVRRGATRYAMTILRVHEANGRCEARRDDDDRTVVRVSVARLLATTADGSGRHYRFLGHVAGRRYATLACFVREQGAWAYVICPEWHPRLQVAVNLSEVPWARRKPGTWMHCEADLGAATAAQLEVSRMSVRPVGHEPARVPQPALELSAVPVAAPAPAPPRLGEGCGDVVLLTSGRQFEEAAAGSVYVTGHPPPVRPGARLYLHAAGAVRAWREVARVRKLPSGVRIELGGPWIEVDVAARVERPVSGVAGGSHGTQQWVWRSWPREHECAESDFSDAPGR